MKDYLIIDIPMFNDVILYIVGDPGVCVQDFLEKEYKDKEYFKDLHHTLDLIFSEELETAIAFSSIYKISLPENRCARLVIIKAKDSSNRDVVIHESIHAAWHFLDKIGIDIDAENHEILCYLVQHITEAIWEYRDKRMEAKEKA